VSEVYEFIDVEYATSGAAPAITLMCRWLEVSKSGYYEWRSRSESATAKRREELKLLVKKAFDDSDGTYGYRRVWCQLARWGVRAGPELVRALMRASWAWWRASHGRGGRPPSGRATPGRSPTW
jgi:putative transposase